MEMLLESDFALLSLKVAIALRKLFLMLVWKQYAKK
jgi:hypothetical protein